MAAVRAELVVQVAHVGLDRVGRQVQLVGDLRRGELGGQVPQHPRLGVAERFAQVLRPGRRRAGLPAGQHIQDLGDQASVRGAMPAMAVEQFGCRVVQEREEQAFWRGAVERLLEARLAALASPSASQATAWSKNAWTSHRWAFGITTEPSMT